MGRFVVGWEVVWGRGEVWWVDVWWGGIWCGVGVMCGRLRDVEAGLL